MNITEATERTSRRLKIKRREYTGYPFTPAVSPEPETLL